MAKIAAFRNRNDLLRSMGFNDDSDINMRAEGSARMNSLVGTEEYLAPETLSDMGELSYTCDYWSLGVILYQLLCGSTPFKGRSDLETYHNIQKCQEITFKKPNIDEKAKDLIRQLLIKEPTLRLGFGSIDEIKGHPYFEGVDWPNVRSSKVPYNPPRPARIKANMSNSFSNANKGASPLVPASPTTSQLSSPIGPRTQAAFFGSANKRDDTYFQQSPTLPEESKGPKKLADTASPTLAPEEQKLKKRSSPENGILLRGTLRKKGLIFLNERYVTVSQEGTLKYYHFDKPGVCKGCIDLTSMQVQ